MEHQNILTRLTTVAQVLPGTLCLFILDVFEVLSYLQSDFHVYRVILILKANCQHGVLVGSLSLFTLYVFEGLTFSKVSHTMHILIKSVRLGLKL